MFLGGLGGSAPAPAVLAPAGTTSDPPRNSPVDDGRGCSRNELIGSERTGLIDVGARSWNGAAYAQTSGALQSGQECWIENSSAPGVDLVLRRLSAAEIAGTAPIVDALRRPALAIGYRAHSTPPQPPGASAAAPGSSSSSTCGLGSGFGIILMLGSLMLRARRRAPGRAT